MTTDPSKLHHPDQPIYRDEEGSLRFKENALVCYILDTYTNMNEVARIPASQADRVQFAQLIGYSLAGFGELNYVSQLDYDRVYENCEAETVAERDHLLNRINALENQLKAIKAHLRSAASEAFTIHPDNLQ